ncbi:squalene synthase HpnC [Chitinibacter sp. SCUT-21]|uniref:squalene synthase HpnC n=1 Tax=Chitinibacter sp. SCUT-21 TaxID=2970891 RepID=UPI0035A74629
MITPGQTVQHYENFPVGSFLLPKPFRKPIAVVYHIARYADDLADEGDFSPEQRIAALDECSHELQRIAQGLPPLTPRFAALVPVVQQYAIPLQLFEDLFSAFRQDVVKSRYDNFGEVIDYCRRSANPVGRILLHIFGYTDGRMLAQSDGICTALQLVNFWQDVAIDLKKDRIYIPQDELQKYGLTDGKLFAHEYNEQFKRLMAFQCERTRKMLRAGSPLGRALPGRIGLEIRTIVLSADRVLHKLKQVNYNIYTARPTLTTLDWPIILYQAIKAKYPSSNSHTGCH